MRRRESFLSSFSNAPYFTKGQLRVLAEKFSVPTSTLNSYISKGLKEKQIIGLKNNYYVMSGFFEKHRNDSDYLFSLANMLLTPSYISLDTALQYYGMFSEAVHYNYTSVTSKLPRRFMTRAGSYSYRNIKESLFDGFVTIKGGFEFTIALPHKAVFDYVYYYTKHFTKNVHPDLFEELRIDTDMLSRFEKKHLVNLLAEFTAIKFRI